MRPVLVAIAGTLAFVTAPAGATVYNGSGFTINDLSTHTSTITVADSGTVNGVEFTLNDLSHTYLSDLFATLTHDGVTVTWLNHTGGSADLNGTYTISDSGSTSLGAGSGSPRVSGTYDPLSPLSAFDGMSVSGDWTLTIADTVGADSGNLGSWNLSLNGITPSVPEPSTWAMMLLGFGAIGFAMRRRPSGSVVAQSA